MEKDLSSVLIQLQEIAKIINNFKSEAVQLRLIDLLFKDISAIDLIGKEKQVNAEKKTIIRKKEVSTPEAAKIEIPVNEVIQPTIKKQEKKQSIKASPGSKREKTKSGTDLPDKPKIDVPLLKTKGATPKKKLTKNRPQGASKTLQYLYDAGFFQERKSIADVMLYCNKTLKMPFKVTDLSGIMTKLVKRGKLQREKDSKTHKYAYINV